MSRTRQFSIEGGGGFGGFGGFGARACKAAQGVDQEAVKQSDEKAFLFARRRPYIAFNT